MGSLEQACRRGSFGRHDPRELFARMGSKASAPQNKARATRLARPAARAGVKGV